MRLSEVTAALRHRRRVLMQRAKWRRERARAYRELRDEARGVPVTFAEKVRYKMAYDRNPVLRTLSDKVAARDWIAQRVGEEFLPRALAVADRPEDIDWSALPARYIAKASHGSGGSIMVSDQFDDHLRLPDRDFEVGWTRYAVRPEHADPASIIGLMRYWLSLNYEWWPGRRPEWAYGGIPPRVLVEEFLDDADAELLSDLKLFVFNGRVQFFRTNFQDADGEKSTTHYDRDGKVLDVSFVDPGHPWPRPEHEVDAPADFPAAIELAERLGRELDFVRVDLYRTDRGLIVGELTNYATAGWFFYDPPEFGYWAGKDWQPSYR